MLDPCAFAMTDVGLGFYDRILILRLQRWCMIGPHDCNRRQSSDMTEDIKKQRFEGFKISNSH